MQAIRISSTAVDRGFSQLLELAIAVPHWGRLRPASVVFMQCAISATAPSPALRSLTLGERPAPAG